MEGRLFYVVGASGVGKDTLIRHARDAIGGAHAVVFAHRYITRPPQPDGENHVALAESEFMLRERHGLFAMAWASHGFRYAVGVEIDDWLAKGFTVVVNGSRSYMPRARSRYPRMRIVWITAGAQALAARLADRGRESDDEISARLQRNSRLDAEPPGDALRIGNDGAPESAGDRFVALLLDNAV